MIQELRTYQIRPGGLERYLSAFEDILMPIVRKHMFLAGFWTTQFGDLNEILHLWDFYDLDHRTACRAALHAEPDWDRFKPIALDLVVQQRSSLLTSTRFAPLSNSGLPPH